ncbi:MAG: CinA family protein [Alloprevotella sp.]|nr:CinA family protein [Alloprevotella sp.]
MDLDLKLASREINQILWNTDKTIATAESCTAGRIATIITAAPGSSTYYRGGLCCYAEEVKTNLLGVSAEVMEAQTPVCEDVVRQMVIGANRLFDTDYAVAVTGYAGPGGSPNGSVLVGTIWIAVGCEGNIVTRKLEEDNGRDQNLASATACAVRMLLDFLKENCPKHTEEASEGAATA